MLVQVISVEVLGVCSVWRFSFYPENFFKTFLKVNKMLGQDFKMANVDIVQGTSVDRVPCVIVHEPIPEIQFYFGCHLTAN